MKRNRVTKLMVVLSFFVLLFAAIGSVVAHPNFTNECGSTGCHETLGVLTLATNSSVDAETGVPFTLRIDAGNGAEYIAIREGWADNDYFTISQVEVEDGSTNDTNAAAGEISAEINFVPLSNGTYTIRIWTAAGGDLAESYDVTVTVTGESGTTPPPPVDLVGIWHMMMIGVPVATAVILAIFGYLALKRK
jgi:hypothetical protein